MNCRITRCLIPLEGVIRYVKTDLKKAKPSLAPKMNFKIEVEDHVTW